MPDIDTVAWQRLPHLLHLHLAHYVVIAELGHQYGFVSELALRHRPHLLDPPDHRQRALRPCVSVLYSSLYSTKTRCHEFPVGAAQKTGQPAGLALDPDIHLPSTMSKCAPQIYESYVGHNQRMT